MSADARRVALLFPRSVAYQSPPAGRAIRSTPDMRAGDAAILLEC